MNSDLSIVDPPLRYPPCLPEPLLYRRRRQGASQPLLMKQTSQNRHARNEIVKGKLLEEFLTGLKTQVLLSMRCECQIANQITRKNPSGLSQTASFSTHNPAIAMGYPC